MQKTESFQHDCLHLAILLGVALAVGVYLIATCVLISPDGAFYIRQAQRLAHDPLGAAGQYPIGYAFLLLVAHKVASVFAAGDSVFVWIVSSQAVTLLCRLAALVFLYLIGRMLVGARRSFWAVLILTVLPYPAHHGSDVLREWPFLMFLAAGFWLLCRALRDKQGWLFALVGLAAGLGYLVRPMCGQLVIYGLLAAVLGFAGRGLSGRRRDGVLAGRVLPALLLVLGFAGVVIPYLVWAGSAVPHQFRPMPSNAPPVIVAVGGQSASEMPLVFEVPAGGVFEAAIEASDPDGDALTFSVAAVPFGTRPVYRFRSVGLADDFWTTSEREMERLLAHRREVWEYEGIDYYSYAEPDAVVGLVPVYRLWSAVYDRHFFTIGVSELQTIITGDPAARWQSEGVVFYVFAPGRQPVGAKAVSRFRDAGGRCYWAVEGTEPEAVKGAGGLLANEGVVWYVPVASPLPDDAGLDGTTFHWRPGAEQGGPWQFNIIVSDGRLKSCQLLRVAVTGANERKEIAGSSNVGRIEESPSVSTPAPRSEGFVKRFVYLCAIGDVFRGVSENLMVFFFVPLCLGLYYRLRREAGPQERVLTVAVLVVNAILIFGRYVWFVESGSSRRYALGLIALTIGYIPVGLECMARGLRVVFDRVFGDRGRPEFGEKVWFCVLAAIGVAICTPKLVRPMGADKVGYRQAAQWLRDNTAGEDVIAVPDCRISFYAERPEYLYRGHVDSRKVDYVVRFSADDNRADIPADWTQLYSCRADAPHRIRLVIYHVP